jgi:transcriptional regulator with XRE-family HTH domain
MQIEALNTDSVVLTELGSRLARTRLERNTSQEQLAIEAGVSKSTVERLESGRDVKLASFIRILRALGLLERLDNLLPEPLPSPIERLKLHGRRRQRAGGRRGGVHDSSGTWTWAAEAVPLDDE